MAALVAAVPLFAAEEKAGVSSWRSKTSPHFEIYHESAWSPGAISLELERMFSTMRLTMAMFAPWMTTQKSRVYIYASQQTYLAGEFNPPRWSKGLAYPQRKTVVVYDTGDMEKLRAVLAHELSHLYFEGYFAEKLSYPPQWLNEGLAVYLEDLVVPGGGPWSRALPHFGKDRRLPFGRLVSAELDKLGGDAQITDWYLQSFAAVTMLYRPSSRLQFKNFCDSLRDGEKLEPALWRNYRIPSLEDFSSRLHAWTDAYRGQVSASPRLSGGHTFKPVALSSYPFTPFGAK
jgi:hypothetical protein